MKPSQASNLSFYQPKFNLQLQPSFTRPNKQPGTTIKLQHQNASNPQPLPTKIQPSASAKLQPSQEPDSTFSFSQASAVHIRSHEPEPSFSPVHSDHSVQRARNQYQVSARSIQSMPNVFLQKHLHSLQLQPSFSCPTNQSQPSASAKLQPST